MTQHTITPCILGTSQDQTMRGKETMAVGFFLEHTNESHHRQKKKKHRLESAATAACGKQRPTIAMFISIGGHAN